MVFDPNGEKECSIGFTHAALPHLLLHVTITPPIGNCICMVNFMSNPIFHEAENFDHLSWQNMNAIW